MGLRELRTYLAKKPDPVVLDARWLPANVGTALHAFMGVAEVHISNAVVSDNPTMEQRGTGMLLRAIPSRESTKTRRGGRRSRDPPPLAPERVDREHEEESLGAESAMRLRRSLSAVVFNVGHAYTRPLLVVPFHQDLLVDPVVITGSETRLGRNWTVAARFWAAGEGVIHCLLVLGNLPPDAHERTLGHLQWAPAYADIRITNPFIVFASTKTTFRGARVDQGANFSGQLDVGPNLGHLIGTDPLVLQGVIARPRALTSEPSEDLLDLETYPRRVVQIDPFELKFVRISSQILMDRELGVSWPQLGIQGEIIVNDLPGGRIKLWSQLPADRGLLVLASRSFDGASLPNIRPLYEICGGDHWFRGLPKLIKEYFEGGHVYVDKFAVSYDLQQRVTTQISMAISGTFRSLSLLKALGRDVVLQEVTIECNVMFPNDHARMQVTLAGKAKAKVDGRFEFDATLGLQGEPWVEGYSGPESGLHLGAVRGAPFLNGVDVPDTNDDTAYDTLMFRLFDDRVELVCVAPPPFRRLTIVAPKG